MQSTLVYCWRTVDKGIYRIVFSRIEDEAYCIEIEAAFCSKTWLQSSCRYIHRTMEIGVGT